MSFAFFRTHASAILFYFFLTLIFILEGLGWNGGRNAAFALVLVMPVFLFLLDLLLHNKITLPTTPALLYCGFLVFSTISTIFSIDKVHSFWYLLFYFSLGLIFLYVYNHREELQKWIIPFIYIFSFIFICYSRVILTLIKINSIFFFPVDGGQYIVARWGSHNSLGDFLILPIIMSLYFLLVGKKRLLNVLAILCAFPFLIFSYSRSAYATLILTLIVMFFMLVSLAKSRISSWKVFFVVCFLFILGILFFATTTEFSTMPIFQPIHTVLQRDFYLGNKPFVARRNIIFGDAFLSIEKRPLLGVGPHNYIYISGKSSRIDRTTTDTAHNLFLDVLSENGVVAGAFFIACLGYVLWKSPKKSLYFFLALSMLFDFQTFYLYRFYSFFLLFFVCLALLPRVNSEDYDAVKK